MGSEHQQAALVAGHQVVGPTRFCHRQQEIVGRIGRPFHARQSANIFRQLLQVIDQPASRVWLDPLRDSRLAQRSSQFVNLFGTDEEGESSILPCLPLKSEMAAGFPL